MCPDIEKAPLWFDPWACPIGEKLRAIAADVVAVLEANEKRTRQRKEVDQRTFERCVYAIVANLTISALLDTVPAIGVPLGMEHVLWAKSRYSRHGLKLTTFRKLLNAMHGVYGPTGEFLEFKKSTWRGTVSNIRPTPAFVAMIEARGVTLQDIGGTFRETPSIAIKRGSPLEPEPIVLTRQDDSDLGKHYVDYRDTPATKFMRQEMVAINQQIAEARIEFVPDGLMPEVCTAQRRLRRCFLLPLARHPQPFAYGGRLYGGFWEHLSRERRRESLRIDGERIAEVDYNACFLRLAFARAGMVLDTPDPYTALFNIRQQHRRGLKGAMAALLFAPGLKRWPQEHAEQLPNSLTPKSVRQVLFAWCPALEQIMADSAGVPIGYSLFRSESDILLAALHALRDAGVTALPLHDAVLVAESKADIARDCLERAARQVAGVHIPTSVWKRGADA